MIFDKDNRVNCSFIHHLDGEQIRQLIELYRAQGWWQAGDDARQDLMGRLVSGSHCFVVATEGKTIIGMGRAISDGISDAYIQDLTVRFDRRNKGIGRLILQTLVERLHAEGIFWIGLISEPGSINLYKRFGFQEMTGSTPMRMIREQ